MKRNNVNWFAEFGRRMKRARHVAGRSQQEVADKLGVSRPQVANIERGISGVELWRLPLLARFLRVSVDELVNFRRA